MPLFFSASVSACCRVRILAQACPFTSTLSPDGHWVARPHGQAPNLNPNRNLAWVRFLEIKSKSTIKSGRKPFGLNSTAVTPMGGRESERRTRERHDDTRR